MYSTVASLPCSSEVRTHCIRRSATSGGQEFVRGRADDLVRRVRELRRVAADLEVGAVGPQAQEQVGQCVEQRFVACVDRCGSPLHVAIVDGGVAGASLARVPEWRPEIVVEEALARLLLGTRRGSSCRRGTASTRARRPPRASRLRRRQTPIRRDRLGRRLLVGSGRRSRLRSGVRCRRQQARRSSRSTGTCRRTGFHVLASSRCSSAPSWRCTPAPKALRMSSASRSQDSSGRVATGSSARSTGSCTSASRAGTRSAGASSLLTYPIAPASRASSKRPGSAPESISTHILGFASRTSRVATIPSMRGMSMSISTTSASCQHASCTASSPSFAIPITSSSGRLCRSIAISSA